VQRSVEDLISADYLRHVVERLESFRSHPLGFRVAGTPEERAAVEFIAAEMRAAGLEDVVAEPVPVDAWRLLEAFVEVDGRRYECASMGGVPETAPAGISGELAFVSRGGRRELDELDVRRKVVLVDWSDEELWPYQIALELTLRDAAAMVVTCLPGGPYYQAERAVGTFDAMWHDGAIPMVTIAKDDAVELRERNGTAARVVLRAPVERGAEAANVVGALPGRERRDPILVGGHHDAWYGGAFDDATGVAATLALARAFTEAGIEPRHPIVFISHTAEEYGITGSRYDWCYGAWYQVAAAHRDWASRALFYLNIEGSGFPASELHVDAPPELAGWAGRICLEAEPDGLLPHGWGYGTPSTWTEVWTFLAAGIPGINVSTFSPGYKETLYHTQYDTSDRLDFEYLAKLTRVFARLLLEADQELELHLDYAARASELERSLAGIATRELRTALRRLAQSNGRARFTAIGRGLYGLNARDVASYPHEQARSDVEALERALAAFRHGNLSGAAGHAELAGLNFLCKDLSEDAFAREHARHGARAPRSCWGAQGDPPSGPNLWRELASLRGEPGARPPGPWIERSLERALARSQRDLDRRLARIAAAVEGRVRRLPRAAA
jgi:Iap family predicted aminopeptidase